MWLAVFERCGFVDRHFTNISAVDDMSRRLDGLEAQMRSVESANAAGRKGSGSNNGIA